MYYRKHFLLNLPNVLIVWLAGVLVPLVLLLSVVIALAATVAISVKNRHKHNKGIL